MYFTRVNETDEGDNHRIRRTCEGVHAYSRIAYLERNAILNDMPLEFWYLLRYQTRLDGDAEVANITASGSKFLCHEIWERSLNFLECRQGHVQVNIWLYCAMQCPT